MNPNNYSFWRRTRKNQRGQAIAFATLWTSVLFGVGAALVIDFGVVYYDQTELNASTQAAALAGAGAMSLAGATTTSTTAAVNTFSGTSGHDNNFANLTGVTMSAGYPLFSCLSTVTTVFGIQCNGPSSSNAIVVKQQVTVPLIFLQLFHSTSITLTSTATASMKGATAAPYNVAIIVDATRSMNDTDSDSNCNNTRFNCALSGVQILLKSLSPCFVSSSTCGTATNGMVSNSVDRVSLFTFPAVSILTAASDYSCSGTPITMPYSFPFSLLATYQIVGFSSDYRTSDRATSLNTGSNIVTAIAGSSGTPCMQAIGGYGTYYAQAINAAQTALAAEKVLYPNSQNAMILLSDGDATSTSSQMPGASLTSGLFMSSIQECHQAITAAQAAATAGTRVYAVAYGAEASGCTTDTNPAITPCETMQQIASSSAYFFSDYTATGGSSSCISASQPVTGLNQIFQVIAGDLGVVKLIPNGTT
jgi:hypothetical protein